MRTTTLTPPSSERLEPFSKVVDGYHIGKKSRAVLCGYIFLSLEAPDYMLTPYHAEAHKLYERGWLEYAVIGVGSTRYKLSKAGERIREQIYDA